MNYFWGISIAALLLSACGGGDASPSANAPAVSSLASSGTASNNTVTNANTSPATPSVLCGTTTGSGRVGGTVSSVHDGDTLTVAGHTIRLDSIDAPELAQAYGTDSRDQLAALVKGQTVTVSYGKKDVYGRIVGTVFKADCSNVNLAQVRAGAAWYYEAYQCEISAPLRRAYASAQALAQSAAQGLWASPATAPWVYRNGVEPSVPASCSKGDAPSWSAVAPAGW